MNNREEVLDVLRKAYQIEVDGYTFYSMTAERAEKEAVQELFAKLAEDEVQHQAFLRAWPGSYDEQGGGGVQARRCAPPRRARSTRRSSPRSSATRRLATEFEMGVLSVGMTLESNAMKYFSTAAQQASEQEVKGFYRFLADWEKQHFDALESLFGAVRTERQAASSFSPF